MVGITTSSFFIRISSFSEFPTPFYHKLQKLKLYPQLLFITNQTVRELFLTESGVAE